MSLFERYAANVQAGRDYVKRMNARSRAQINADYRAIHLDELEQHVKSAWAYGDDVACVCPFVDEIDAKNVLQAARGFRVWVFGPKTYARETTAIFGALITTCSKPMTSEDLNDEIYNLHSRELYDSEHDNGPLFDVSDIIGTEGWFERVLTTLSLA